MAAPLSIQQDEWRRESGTHSRHGGTISHRTTTSHIHVLSCAAKKAERRAERKPAAASRSSESVPSKFLRVAVGGFPAGTTEEEVSAHLASAGRITSSKATKDGSLVIVTFEEESAAEKALKLNGSNYKSSKLSVEKALRQPRAAGTGAEGGARAGRKRTSDEEGEAPRPKVDLATVVWVGNLRAGITTEDVRSMFSLYGPVAEGARAVLVTQVKGKPARPAKEDKPELPATQDGAYAYVTFTEAGSASKAVSGANGKDGLKVELASREPRKGGQRRRYTGPRKPRA